MSEKNERIAKIMARAGLCSRREAERWIEDGRVKVNGQVLETPAVTVSDQDRVVVDGKVLAIAPATRLWLYHKPVGLVTTHKDEQGRQTVFDTLPRGLPRVISIGRLDLNSEGLLLLTNDGAFSRLMEHPDNQFQRTYRVRVKGVLDPVLLDKLKNGIMINGMRYGAIDVQVQKAGEGKNHWLLVTLHEGKNREIRKVMDHIGLSVNRLIRLSYADFNLGKLLRGKVEEVSPSSLKTFMKKIKGL